MWSAHFFFLLSYVTLIISLLIYLIPVTSAFYKFSNTKSKSNFFFLNSTDLYLVCATPYLVLTLLLLMWSSHTFSAWFGHLVFAGFSYKITFVVLGSFMVMLCAFTSTVYFSSKEIFDYLITKFNFLYWILVLFFSNSLFTTIFIIEVLSTLIFLLIITSVFSTTFFYRNLNLSFGHIFQHSTPYSYIQSILYFFWISLVSSLNLFIFVIFFFYKIYTLDYYITEHIFSFFVSSNSFKEVLSLGLVVFVILFCIFLKCGLAPLYLWKPTFFKGIPLYTIFFYVCFFYFFLFLFFIHFLVSYMSTIFFFYIAIALMFLISGVVTLLFVLCESMYLKAFLAMSSILNSLLVLLATTSSHSIDIFFVL
jgi:hypothetical protein